MYRLHKWLGIGALVASVLHWWWAQGTKWMVGWGWLERPARKAGGNADTLGTLEAWLRSQRGLAESVGEWAFYAAAVLLVLALVKRFPYHWFVQTHRLIALAYLALAYHTVVLMKADYWAQPIGWVSAVLVLVGCWAALWTWARAHWCQPQAPGPHRGAHALPGAACAANHRGAARPWPGHRAGQFAFVTSNPREGAHPYTIASAWQPEQRQLVFITKALGNHASRLPHTLQVGMPVTVEGPYGCFDFEDAQPQQIWIGAGIGITPFIARMQQRAAQPDGKAIDLFHPTADFDAQAIERLRADAQAGGVKLHLLVNGKDGRLNGERIRAGGAAVAVGQHLVLWPARLWPGAAGRLCSPRPACRALSPGAV